MHNGMEKVSMSLGLFAALVGYTCAFVAVLMLYPATPMIFGVFVLTYVLNSYVSNCVLWRVADVTKSQSRPNASVVVVSLLNAVAACAVPVTWLTQSAGVVVGDKFATGVFCSAVGIAIWVGRLFIQLVLGIDRVSGGGYRKWNHAFQCSGGNVGADNVKDKEEVTRAAGAAPETLNDNRPRDTEIAGTERKNLTEYLMHKYNTVTDKFYEATAELMRNVSEARMQLGQPGDTSSKATAVCDVVSSAAKRAELAEQGTRLAEKLREEAGGEHVVLEEPWTSDTGDSLLEEVWGMAVESHDDGHDPALDKLVEHADALMEDTTAAIGTGKTVIEHEREPGQETARTSDRINQTKNKER